MIIKIKTNYNDYKYNERMLKRIIGEYIRYPESRNCAIGKIVAFDKTHLFIELSDSRGERLDNANVEAKLIYVKTSHGSPVMIDAVNLVDNVDYSTLKTCEWDTQFSDGTPINVYISNNIGKGIYGCNADEELNSFSLSKYNGPMCRWDYTIKTKVFYSRDEICSNHELIIYRNDKKFYSYIGSLASCQARATLILNRVSEHPADLCFKDYDKKLIGRLVWFKDQPGIITYCGPGFVIIEPDYKDKSGFKLLGRDKYDDINPYDEGDIKADLFSPNIDWFREEGQE